MNIYEVKFWTTIFIDEEDHTILDLPDDELKEKLKSPTVHAERSDGKFHVGAYNLGKAFIEAYEFLDKSVGENQYEIIGVKEKEEISIINWPDDNGQCPCLTCRTERAAEEDKLRFNCKSCGKEVVVVDDGWDQMECPNCNEIILRDRIIGSNGNYIMIDPEPKKKKGGKSRKSDENTV